MKTTPAVFVLLLFAATLRAQEKPDTTATPRDDAAKAKIVERLNGIVMPQIIFQQATLPDIVDYLHRKSVEIEDAPEQAKITFHNPPTLPQKHKPAEPSDVPGMPVDDEVMETKVTLRLNNIPLSEVLRYVADEAGVKLAVGADGVRFRLRGGFHGGEDAEPNAILLPAKAQEENRKLLSAKLDRIILPQVTLNFATLGDVLSYLRKKSVELDDSEHDPARTGINIVLKTDTPLGNGVPEAGDRKISMSVTNIPLRKVLEYIAKLSGMKVIIDPHAVVIEPDPKADHKTEK